MNCCQAAAMHQAAQTIPCVQGSTGSEPDLVAIIGLATHHPRAMQLTPAR